jgi:hypothetical protein
MRGGILLSNHLPGLLVYRVKVQTVRIGLISPSAGLKSRAVPRWSLPISQLNTFQLEIAGSE